MAVNASVSKAIIPSCSDFPFLWESTRGCVYLRNCEGKDIIIGPRVCDNKVGRVVVTYLDDKEAWARRLPFGSSVILRQEAK